MNHSTSEIKEIVFEVIKSNSEDMKIIDENKKHVLALEAEFD